jgi:hypothetical protein
VKKRHDKIVRIREVQQASRESRLKKDWDAYPIKGSRLVKEIYLNFHEKAVIVNEAVMNSFYLEHFNFKEPYTFAVYQ